MIDLKHDLVTNRRWTLLRLFVTLDGRSWSTVHSRSGGRMGEDKQPVKPMSNSPWNNRTSCHAVPALISGWGMAGLMAITIGVTVAMRGPLDEWPMFWQAAVGIVVGWTVLMLCAPWRLIHMFRNQRRVMRELSAVLETYFADRGTPRISKVLCERQDEIGRLARAATDICAELDACRKQRCALQRSMNEKIVRETRLATSQLHLQACTDPLTGLGNRRGMTRWLDEYFSAQGKADAWMIAMAMDIDLFKPVNDILGHETGDACLAFLGELLGMSMQNGHCAARLGGDEFLVLMTGLEVDEAHDLAQHISKLFNQMPWPHAKPQRPTLSIGLAHGEAREHQDVESIIRMADQALYASKREGRNRTTAVGTQAQQAAA